MRQLNGRSGNQQSFFDSPLEFHLLMMVCWAILKKSADSEIANAVLPDHLMINDAATLSDPIFIKPSDFVVQCVVGEMISPDKVAKFTW